jgi:hypothetical protein
MRQAGDARSVGRRRHELDVAAKPPQSFRDQRADARDTLDISGARFDLDQRLERAEQRLLLALRQSPDRLIRLRGRADRRKRQEQS